jgi:hypothetical protein
MADIETIEKRLLADRKKARSDKKIATIVSIYEKVLEKLNE